MRFLPAGESGVLIHLDNLDQVLALHASLQDSPPAGIVEMVPAAETLMIIFDRRMTTAERLAAAIASRNVQGSAQGSGRVVEIPVRYDGQDLDDVASLTGLSRDEVIARHTGTNWRAAFAGFAPGFCYLSGGDRALEVPRRSSPRTAIPPGSVALAGLFSAVYPKESPGGWQIIGTTPQPMWDLDRDPPAWLMPGDEVRFVDLAAQPKEFPRPAPAPDPPAPEKPDARLDVLAAPFPLLLQDGGRQGKLAQGVSASGAVDQGALRALNRLLGNPPGTAALELIGGGIRLRATAACEIALTGAPRIVTIEGGAKYPSHAAIPLDAGDVLRIGPPSGGMYGYLGSRGGFEVAPVLDSAATDTLAHLGPAPLTAGGWVGLARARADAIAPPLDPPSLPQPGDVVEIDVVMGPRADWFPPEIRSRLTDQDWTVTQQSSRIGKRLEGEAPLIRDDSTELPSEATLTGAIQVPHSGQPVLFLADHPLTGGYPVIAVVAAHHLDLAAQLPPGAKLRFRALAPFAPIIPSQEEDQS
ncbi:urea amidolyase family protein [Paracoccus sediminicola]|uniref:5-oxoprolinase subunit B/C family protein n=1 Tax=Paracoccus sediminicola TaxID=3017783 RepID=UPI0022F01064|nr:urea amidolyase family protein [Paracoccus sediminicola]WBU56094.1 urea amidolyase family protein [Paracoccus sediminicola]